MAEAIFYDSQHTSASVKCSNAQECLQRIKIQLNLRPEFSAAFGHGLFTLLLLLCLVVKCFFLCLLRYYGNWINVQRIVNYNLLIEISCGLV